MRMSRYILIILFTLLPAMDMAGKGVMRYRRYTTADGLLQNYATTFAQDKDGYIWIGSRSGLCRFDGNRFVPFNLTADGKKIGWVRRIRVDKDGHTLLMKINNDKFVSYNPATRKLTPLSEKIDLGDQKLPTDVFRYGDKGVILHHHGEEHMIAYMGATPSEIMHCENFIDRQGNIWASFDNAVYQITFSKADNHIYKKVGDAAGTDFTGDVRCITRLKDGTLLVGTKAKQLIRYAKEGTFMGFINQQGKMQPQATEFLGSAYNVQQDNYGRLWIGLREEGLVCIDKPFTNQQKLHHYRNHDTPRLPMDQIFDLHLSAKTGWLWIATWGKGIVFIDTQSPKLNLNSLSASVRNMERSEMLQVRRIQELGDTIAVSTTMGIFLYNQKGKLISRIGDIDVSGIVRVGKQLYVGAYSQGAFLVDKANELQQIDIPGLGDCIHSIQGCLGNQVLFTNPDGLILYDTQRGSVRYFDHSYFGEDVAFSEIQPRLEKDMLITGLKNGILQLQLGNHPSHSSFRPTLLIPNAGTSVSMGGELIVNPTVIDYRVPRTVSYAWRNKGDSTWHYLTGGKNEIALSWILPGKHVVEFRSTDALGFWVDQIVEAEFYVVPSWWQCCILVLLVVALVVIACLVWKMQHPKLITTSDTTVDTAQDIFPSTPDVTPYDRQLAKRLVDCIEQHIDNPDYDVEKLGNDMGMSRSQLYSQCKDTLDKTPAAFILEIRMKRAMQLMETHDLRVNEIAYRVGFTDPKYFAKVFKKRVGVSPTQYSQQFKSSKQLIR